MLQPVNGPAWLLLVHQLPPRPTSLRVKTWRRLQDVGAVALKNSVYVLPNSDQSREDFEWIKAEIQAMRGEAAVFAAHTIDTFTNDEVIATFRKARAADYASLAGDSDAVAAAAAGRHKGIARPELTRRVAQLQRRLASLDAVAFFPPHNRDAAANSVGRLARLVDGRQTHAGAAEALNAKSFRKRLWITRPRPGIDRLASAWLIRRFIDPKARFSFAAHPPHDGTAVAFDMFGVEFSHSRHGCTFETLVARFGVSSEAVVRLAQIVHDLDLKETRYNLPEAPALAQLIDGLRAMYADDDALLAHGVVMFEALYRAFSTPAAPAPARRRRSKRNRRT